MPANGQNVNFTRIYEMVVGALLAAPALSGD
jgi:hypothetical protein